MLLKSLALYSYREGILRTSSLENKLRLYAQVCSIIIDAQKVRKSTKT